jgi:beta-lactam-binding protein with PASTA domain
MGFSDATSVVPTLVGLPAEDAHNRALDSKLLAVDQDPTHKASSPGRVTAQMPSPGSELGVGEQIMIWVEDAPNEGGGGRGDQRVPVGPAPVRGAGAK